MSVTNVARSNDSESLRNTFYTDKDKIEDGWTIVSEVDDGGSYETNLTMYLLSPAGELMELDAGCCSCYGIDDQWDPYPTTLETLKHELERYNQGNFLGSERLEALKEAIEYMEKNA